MARLHLDYSRGKRRRTDATQTRAHIERLIAAGWLKTQIARTAGLNHHTVIDVLDGQPTVANRVALAILSIPIGQPPADTRDTDATGTIRRLRALVAIGWPIAQLAPRIGLYETACGNIVRGELRQVRTATAQAVAAVYRDLSRTPGPSNRTRILTAKKRWAPPAAWDDDRLDDPTAVPDWTGHCGTDRGWWLHSLESIPVCQPCETAHEQWKTERAHLTRNERWAELGKARTAASSREANLAHDARELMRISGLDYEQAAERLGVTRNHLQQAMLRHPETTEAVAA
jgi:plasmid maintenance system antidote protein VapI